MTIKDLREILVHFSDSKYNDYEVILWDYEHQQQLSWGGMFGFSKPEKRLTFPVYKIIKTNKKCTRKK